MSDIVQMVDLKSQYLSIKNEIDDAIQGVIDTTAFINGPEVTDFSNDFAAYNNIKNVVTCANGTDAIQIALMTLGLKPGDEVILPVHTYVATAEVIALLNLKPVFIDVLKTTFNINTDLIENVITTKTKAIVPVHLYGQCADMEPILDIAKKYNLWVIEDAAQAIGAKYTFSDGTSKKAGTMGDIGCTSFFPSKNLGCFGDGGAVLINDPELAVRAKMIANHGQRKKYYHDIIGCNSRLDTIQAAILKIKLKYLDEYNHKRNIVASKYNNALNGLDGVITPVTLEKSSHVYHQYTLQIILADRNEVKERLAKVNIPSMIYYPVPLHLQLGYKGFGYLKTDFPIAEYLSETVLSLPIHTEMDDAQQNLIIDHLIKILNE